MKVVELQLLAFGPFTDLCLDLSEGEQGFHVLYGPNEAGKSSALRALKALLYGIPGNTKDNFIHENRKMRIGGHLLHSDGSELTFLRRKGNKDTLLNIDGEPIDDRSLDRFLNSIEEALFFNLFAIGHEALVQGGRDILRGGGEVGESLFAAGLGSANLHKVLEDLDEEADSLFRQRGKSQIINKAIAEFQEKKKKASSISLSGRNWSEHDEALKVSITDRQKLIGELEHLKSEKTRFERLKDAFPKIAKREDLRAKLDELGDVVILPAEFSNERQENIRNLQNSRIEEKHCENAIVELEKDVSQLDIPELLLEQEETITDLHQRLGNHRKAAADLSKLRGGQQQLLTDAKSLIADLWSGLSLEKAQKLRLTAAQKARIHELANQYQTLTNKLERTKEDVQDAEEELAAVHAEMGKLESPRDPQDLRLAINQIRKRGDLENTYQEASAQLRAEEDQIQIDLEKLGLWSGPLDDLEKLAVPPRQTVDRFEADFHDVEAKQKDSVRRSEEAREELRNIEKSIEELQLTGAVPSESDLKVSRDNREEGWRLVRRAWLNNEDVSEEIRAYDSESDLPEAYEKSVIHADEISDRLRREADRVTQNASLESRRNKVLSDLGTIEANEVELAEQAEQVREEWAGLWKSIDVNPLSPKEMRTWMIEQANLAGQAEMIRNRRQSIADVNNRIDHSRQELNKFLTDLDEKKAAPNESLEVLLERSQEAVNAIEKTDRKRKELETGIDKSQKRLDKFANEKTKLEGFIDRWRSDWAAAVKPLNLAADSLPAEANAVLTQLEQFLRALGEADKLKARIQSIEKDSREFEQDVGLLAKHVAVDLANMPPEQAAAQLNSRLVKAQKDSARLSELKKQIEEKKESAREAKIASESATENLNSLCRQAGCSEHEELKIAEERSAELRDLKREMEALEVQLHELAAGSSIEVLIREAETVNFDSLPARISEVSHQVVQLEEKRSELDQAIGSEQTLLAQMDGSAEAAEAAEEAQSVLARIRTQVDRYVRIRLAASILRREIKRYREENQGPLLTYASELFSQLTMGSFSELQTDFNEKDEPILLGLRPSSMLVDVEGMSDGTRDQLYLSLRLASIQQYLEKNEPMPFVVDDILIRFDDERAEATLKFLGELSGKTQILFFTHHSRLVELAEKAVTGNSLKVHRLGG